MKTIGNWLFSPRFNAADLMVSAALGWLIIEGHYWQAAALLAVDFILNVAIRAAIRLRAGE